MDYFIFFTKFTKLTALNAHDITIQPVLIKSSFWFYIVTSLSSKILDTIQVLDTWSDRLPAAGAKVYLLAG